MIALVLFLVLIAIPIAEIVVLIEVGGIIGTIPTIALVVLTAVAGTALIRWQGRGVLAEAQRSIDSGGAPVNAVVDGVFLLLSGALLLTPGFITDAIGFSFLVPPFRRAIARVVWKAMQERGTIHTYSSRQGGSPPNSAPKTTIIEADYEVVDPVDTDDTGGGKPDGSTPWRPKDDR